MLQVSKKQFFAYLLTLLVGWSCFSLKVLIGLVGFTVGPIIGRIELIGRNVAIAFF